VAVTSPGKSMVAAASKGRAYGVATSIALFLVLAPETRTMLDTVGKWKRVVRACAKT